MKKLREIVEATKSLHPMALHVKPVMVNGQQKYKVHAVGNGLADGIKHGEHLSDSELDDAHEMGAKVKHVKEDVNEGKMAELDTDLKNMKDKDFETHYGKPKSNFKPAKKPMVEPKPSNVKEAESHQASTTMKHIPNASPALKKAAKDIKPGIMGYADRIAMLKAGGVKEEMEQIDELSKSTLGSYLTKKTSEYMKGKTQPGSKEHAKDVQNMGKAYDKLKKEEAELDEAYQTAKSEFVARQGRLTAAAAETEKDPARLKRMSSIPGYSAAMDLAKKTTLGAKHTKEDVEELDELSKTTLGSYAKKASRDAVITRKIGVDFENKADRARSPVMKAASDEISQRFKSKSFKRRAGVDKAVDRLTKEETDFGPEADKNITVQLKKAMDMMEHGEKTGSDIEFADGQKHFVEGVIAHKVLVAMEQMKPEVRAQAQNAVYQSFAHLMAAHQMLSK